jgi:chemotaxis protein CheC
MIADQTMSELEIDALKEMMNIGFGRAAATLSEIMDVNLLLSVPIISMVGAADIAGFIRHQASGNIAYSMVEQFFLGKFAGTSLLLLPEAEGRNLISLFSTASIEDLRTQELDNLARETIMEIGNILIGACVGMISELMNNHVTFRPPQYLSGTVDRLDLDEHLKGAGSVALIFKTIFHFDKMNIQGNLFLITSDQSVVWMKSAIDDFLKDIR